MRIKERSSKKYKGLQDAELVLGSLFLSKDLENCLEQVDSWRETLSRCSRQKTKHEIESRE